MRTVVITGSSRGIGLELARQCAARGDVVFATCREPETASELRADACAEHAARLLVTKLDADDPRSVDEAGRYIAARTSAVDVLFNNAGRNRLAPGYPAADDPASLSAELLMGLFRTNVLGPLLVIQCLRPLLGRSPGSKVVCLSSERGSLTLATHGRSTAYAVSKTALNMLVRKLAFELAPEGIIVVAVHPGWVRTGMGGPAAPDSPGEAAQRLLRLVDGLTPSEAGGFLGPAAERLPW